MLSDVSPDANGRHSDVERTFAGKQHSAEDEIASRRWPPSRSRTSLYSPASWDRAKAGCTARLDAAVATTAAKICVEATAVVAVA